MPKIQLYTQTCIQQMFKCSMHVSNWRVIYKGDIDQTLMPKNIPTLAPKPLPIIYMPCFTSQLTNLRLDFVRPHVPRQSDHVIGHMVRYNTEASANI